MANINSDFLDEETIDKLDDQKVIGRPLTMLADWEINKIVGALDDAIVRTTQDLGGEGPLSTESLSDVGGPINAALGLAKLNASGKLLDSVIPALAINDIFTPADEAAMLALSTAQQGDIAIRTDNSTAYILSASDPAVLANWKELSAAPVPADFNDGGDTAGANRLLGNTDAYSLALITSGTPRLTVQSGGQVDVAGQIKIAGGAPGLGKVLTSDADGLASWSDSPDFFDGGDTAGANRSIGNTDAYDLSLITGGTPRLTVGASGGVTVPSITGTTTISGAATGQPTLEILPNADEFQRGVLKVGPGGVGKDTTIQVWNHTNYNFASDFGYECRRAGLGSGVGVGAGWGLGKLAFWGTQAPISFNWLKGAEIYVNTTQDWNSPDTTLRGVEMIMAQISENESPSMDPFFRARNTRVAIGSGASVGSADLTVGVNGISSAGAISGTDISSGGDITIDHSTLFGHPALNIDYRNGNPPGDEIGVNFRRRQAAAAGLQSVLTSAHLLGQMTFKGFHGDLVYRTGARIKSTSTGSWLNTGTPANLEFQTATTAGGGPVTRVAIEASGEVAVKGDHFRIETAKTPASATSAGTTGQIAWDSGFIYVCTAGGGEGAATWVRAALSTW